MIRRAMKLDFELCLDLSKLDILLDVFDLVSRVVGLIPNYIKRNLKGKFLLWFEVGIDLGFFFIFYFLLVIKLTLVLRKCFLDLDMALYFRRVFVWFFSLSVSHFLIWEASIIGNSMVFDLQFFLNIYLELIIKFEFNLALHLIFSKKKKKTTFHMGLFLFLLM